MTVVSKKATLLVECSQIWWLCGRYLSFQGRYPMPLGHVARLQTHRRYSATRRPRNLKDLLIHARISTPSPSLLTGNSPCKGRNCKCCAEIVTWNTFSSTTTSRTYNIRSEMACKSSNLVYLITCKRCNLQYVGETKQPLHIRMNEHVQISRPKKTDKPVAAHFCRRDHHTKDVEVRGIEKIHHGGTLRRRERESFWIFTLRTLSPEGLNLGVGTHRTPSRTAPIWTSVTWQ